MNTEFENNMREFELIAMNDKAKEAVAVATAAAGATGAIPIPFADAPLLVGEQVTLMASICKIYKIDIATEGLKALALTALSCMGATYVGKTIARNVIKLIPGVGSVAGGVVGAGTAAAVTYAIGNAFIEMCKLMRMGELSEVDMTSEAGKRIFKSEFTKFYKKK